MWSLLFPLYNAFDICFSIIPPMTLRQFTYKFIQIVKFTREVMTVETPDQWKKSNWVELRCSTITQYRNLFMYKMY